MDTLGTIAAIVAALTGIVSVRLTWLQRKDTLRQMDTTQSRQWNLGLTKTGSPDVYFGVLRLRGGEAYYAHSVRVISPRQILIANVEVNSSGHTVPPERTAYADRFSMGRSLSPGSETLFCVKVGSRPWLSQRSSTRLSIELSLEEISAERHPSRIIVRSPLIDWMARATSVSA